MPSYDVVNFDRFRSLRWTASGSFGFAAENSVAEMVVAELPKACLSLPLVFIKQGIGFVPAAVQGLEPAQNLFVVNDCWTASYIPAVYRSYPFRLSDDADDMHLCVDMDSGLVGAGDGFDMPFFDEAGAASQPVKEVLNFLEQIHRNRAVTQRVCGALAAEDLFQPWPLKVQGPNGERRVDGLFRIDEARLNSLDPEALARVQKAGGLPVAYCQLLSMGNIQTLGLIARKLEEVKNRMPEMSDQIDVDGVLQRHKANDNLDSVETDNDHNLVNVVADEGDFDLSSFVNSKSSD